ncbi:MAG: archaellum operon transcriptional activator EarA family protein [bacterium]|nr:archaellum operon transcriptional activator EarA family protein [bacterium]MDO8496382.1 archaellum operon transcriptional activator EarA family protein [bacterium]
MSKVKSQHLVLEGLFNSRARVKVLKFLFRNYPANTGVYDLSKRVQEPIELIKRELRDLEEIGLITKI